MTAAGAESRANYLLKWEAIRSSREAGATSYDLWGLATGGIAHFKTGFGGREVRYIGAWDLVLDPLGRRAYELAQRGRVSVGPAARRDRRRRERRGLRRRPIERPRRGRRRAGRLGRAHRRGARRPRLPVAGVGRRIARAAGWQPRFLVADDGGRALALRPAVAGRRPAAAPTCRAGPSPTGAEAGGPRLRG